jgi:hypothetical protein
MSQGLAVYLDIGLMQPIDKLAVAHVIHSACSIDAGNPKTAELAFLQFAMSKCKDHGAFDRLTGNAISFTSAAKVASGCEHIFFSSAMGCYIVCTSRHLNTPLYYQHPVNSFLISFTHNGAGSKITFQFWRFFGLDVRAFGVMAHYLTGAG